MQFVKKTKNNDIHTVEYKIIDRFNNKLGVVSIYPTTKATPDFHPAKQRLALEPFELKELLEFMENAYND